MTYLMLFLLLVSPFAHAQTQNTQDMAREVNRAIQQGNARAMARHFGPLVEIYIPGSEGTFSRSQAEFILRDFFSKNQPTAFTINRQDVARDGSLYVIGILRTRDGTSYRAYFQIKKVGQSFFLHQFQLEFR